MMQPKEADTVGNLCPDPVKSGQIFKGVFIVHSGQAVQIQTSLHGILTDSVNVRGAVAQLQCLKLIQGGASKLPGRGKRIVNARRAAGKDRLFADAVAAA